MTIATVAKVAPLEEQDADWTGLTVIPSNRGEPLRECVRAAVCTYLRNMDGQDVEGLHRFVMDEVERPLIETVLEAAGNNQSVAARMLSISRSTLRKKLAAYAAADGDSAR
ncbi:MAG: Fis family transcriptional regulator [Gammaproteobacteria bacterium]|jgi:Fis family transcriptional regulator|nr:Fis family transcriptional regulator [Gammaproteobacteria bacterium]